MSADPFAWRCPAMNERGTQCDLKRDHAPNHYRFGYGTWSDVAAFKPREETAS